MVGGESGVRPPLAERHARRSVPRPMGLRVVGVGELEMRFFFSPPRERAAATRRFRSERGRGSFSFSARAASSLCVYILLLLLLRRAYAGERAAASSSSSSLPPSFACVSLSSSRLSSLSPTAAKNVPGIGIDRPRARARKREGETVRVGAT